MQLIAGDFALWRHATVQVIEIGPTEIIVRQRNGARSPIPHSVADRELVPVPKDGFWALRYQREIDPVFLTDKVEELIVRLMRDRRRNSIALSEIKREFAPILEKDEKNWESWWKQTRKKILASGRIIPDTNQKNVFLLNDATSPSPSKTDWLQRIENSGTAHDLLQLARELRFASDVDRAAALILEG